MSKTLSEHAKAYRQRRNARIAKMETALQSIADNLPGVQAAHRMATARQIARDALSSDQAA